MRRRVRAVAIVAVTAVVTVAGCAQTVSGTAQRANPGVPDPERSYGYVDNRCGLLEDSSIQEMLGAQTVVRPYSGAVCQYVLERDRDLMPAPPTTIDVVFSWFETGSLDRERTWLQQRGAKVTDKVVERHQAFLARRDTNGAGCSATAAAGPGVLSWWVQTRGQDRRRPVQGRREAARRDAVVGPVTMSGRRPLPSAPRWSAGVAVLAAAAVRRTGPPRRTDPPPAPGGGFQSGGLQQRHRRRRRARPSDPRRSPRSWTATPGCFWQENTMLGSFGAGMGISTWWYRGSDMDTERTLEQQAGPHADRTVRRRQQGFQGLRRQRMQHLRGQGR